ncbi:hypothetical protein [Ornithinibacillus halotolerans]|uniref:Phosphatidylinositol kinase n=1 Tax=Ornithinibacillus halotolerans TaxID=1274357 RepID=A0A916RZG1_9BACI|nr:hypothetical protein [Ornithinibacillus halotolerans]GGA73913.1 hypothetical protein GCM10008025_17040 [Ornithinibacillus halotolerans]
MAKHKQMYDLCKSHMHSYVLAELEDGSKFDGIITGLDDEYVYFAVPLEQDVSTQTMPYMDNEQRQFGWYGGFGYGYPGYGFPGYGYGFGYPYGPRRRFRRLVLPLAALTALSVLPWY